jgi:hypothetical protein
MQQFTDMATVARARLPTPIHKAVTKAVQTIVEVYGDNYDANADGWVVLVDQSTTNADARELCGRCWNEMQFEGVSYDRETGTFLGVIALSNSLAHSIIIPDSDWLPAKFRAHLLEHLHGEGPP